MNSSELAGDRDAFNFSKLPEIIGSGEGSMLFFYR